MMLKSFLAGLVLSAAILTAQDAATRKSITLAEPHNVPTEDILKLLRKECPDVSVISDSSKEDYRLEATNERSKGTEVQNPYLEQSTFDLTLFDRDGKVVRDTSKSALRDAVKDVCHAAEGALLVEVVDTHTLTQSQDARGDTSGGAVGAVVSGLTGRRTHTDTSTIYVIANGEHALLDCYERRTGCSTIGPGKYYGEQDGESIWVTYEMPITHKRVRNHYKIAGGW